jgi:DNA-binding NarL/FixJ family response regulator
LKSSSRLSCTLTADMELVAEASDGEEAIAQFRKHHPDGICKCRM